MSFRTNENLQRYEYVRFHLDNVIEQPANNQSQKKTGYRFTINDRSTMFDFFNGYFEVTKELQKRADGAGYAAADRITMINGSHSLIRHMVIKSSGKIVYESDNLHRITNVKISLNTAMTSVDPLERIRSGILILMELQQIQTRVSRHVVF